MINNIIDRFSKQFSLQALLTFPFVIQFFIVFDVFVWLSSGNYNNRITLIICLIAIIIAAGLGILISRRIIYRLNDVSPDISAEEQKPEKAVNDLNELFDDSNLQFHMGIMEGDNPINELQQVQSQMIHSEKMAGLGTLVAEIAHEINNPTNFVHGITHNLQKNISELKNFIFELAGEEADDKFVEMFNNHFQKIESNLNDLSEGSQRIKTIIKDLRTFSRMDEEGYSVVDINEGILTTLRLIKPTYNKQVEFITDFQEKREIDGWPAQLNQVFMNILVNACQAILIKQEKNGSDTLGKIHIKTFLADAKVGAFHETPLLGIEFTDDGIGMTEEVKNRIFEPFFTTKDAANGTGMGMSITSGIIEKHHGHIDVQSEPGKGTTLSLFLPIKHIAEEN